MMGRPKLVGLGLCIAAALVAPGGAAARSHHPAGLPSINHNVVIGDVTASSALFWARTDQSATLNVRLSGGPHAVIPRLRALPGRDFTVRLPLDGLAAGRVYRYRAWFSRGGSGPPAKRAVRGTFQTAPPAKRAAPLRLAFGGDLAGQNVCRDRTDGFPILATVRARHPDVFVGLGDMIYADNACSAVGMYGNSQIPGDFGPAADLATFWAHYRYVRADAKLERLLRGTDYVGVWDDHEVINDFGPSTDFGSGPPYTAGVHLMPLGLQAFLDYTPISSAQRTPNRLYRSLRWGRNAEIFALDTRQYRDPNFADDTDAHPKTMLGATQLAWLKRRLLASRAKWKVIISSVPMSIPTGFPATNGRDGWANFDQTTGYEHELLDILRFMHDHGIRNSVWITTDVHFSEAFRYTPFPADPGFAVYELVTGPMNSGIFPTPNFDTTLNPERLGMFAPPSAAAVTSWAQAKHWFNFGELDFSRRGSLTLRVINTAGDTEFIRTLRPS